MTEDVNTEYLLLVMEIQGRSEKAMAWLDSMIAVAEKSQTMDLEVYSNVLETRGALELQHALTIKMLEEQGYVHDMIAKIVAKTKSME